MTKISARQAAFRSVLASLREESFISDSLEKWSKESHPTEEDYRLALEIANGTIRRLSTLEWMAKDLSKGDPLHLKNREKALLYTALYQSAFTDKIPLYAIIHETVEIAKKQIHPSFGKFLNQLLRRVENHTFTLPQDLSIHYSYPPYFIGKLKKIYPESYLDILEIGNEAPKTFARKRGSPPFEYELLKGKEIQEYSQKTDYYIQNPTPGHLMEHLFKERQICPKKILDLCASPGGKSLMLADLFPLAHITANDISAHKTLTLEENFKKYKMPITITAFDGREYPLEEKFDLVVVDAPCSNTGVLGRRSEARWRLNEKNINELQVLQKQLVERGMQLVNEGGELWYLTCSILPMENAGLENGFYFLPNKMGEDGGSAFKATRKKE